MKHYIYDEKLKVDREYIEVAHESERVAVNEGDYVVWYHEGETDNKPAKVTDVGVSCVDVEPYYDDEGEEVVAINHGGYRKLEFTGVIRKHGQIYRIVGREANAGDTAIVLSDCTNRFSVGQIITVKRSDSDGDIYVEHPEGSNWLDGTARLDRLEYMTLEPKGRLTVQVKVDASELTDLAEGIQAEIDLMHQRLALIEEDIQRLYDEGANYR